MMIRRTVIHCAMGCLRILLVICGFVSTAQAQYSFDHWTAETGLPQNIVTAIHQTPEGYLWIATLDGLTRFDGVRFTVFNKSNTPGLTSNRFYCLYQDAEGDLWAGTEVGVVTRLHQGQFITYTSEHGLPKSFVWGVTGDSQGHVWVFSGNKLREWEPVTGRFTERDTPPFSGGSGNLVWKVDGGFWGIHHNSLHLFSSGKWTQITLPAELGGPLKRVAQADDGVIWIVGARIFQFKDGKSASFPLVNKEPGTFTPMTEWRDRSGKLWEMEVVQNLLRKVTIASSGQPETIILSTLYEDRDGNLWLGTDGQGLYRIRKQIVTAYSKEQGLIGRNVYPIYEDRAGTIWAGAWDGGLSQIKAGKITNLTTRQGLGGGEVTAFCEDREGRMWVATDTDLQLFEQGRFTSVKAQYTPGQRVNVIFQDQSGAMWFGADNGLSRYHEGQEQHFTTREGLPGEVVPVIIEAAKGGVWVGCYGGLVRWVDGKITTWTEQDGLPGNALRSLYEDRDGVLWIGTYDSGLGRFKDGKFTTYTTREGLFNDGVFRILEDAYGSFWMSSNRGIYRVRKQELNEFADGQRREITSIAFGKNDGMLNVECNGGLWPAGVRSRDGRVWFPTQDGVAMIDPAVVTTNQQPPSVLIEAVLLDRSPINFRDEVRIQPGQGNLEIQYTALSFTNASYLRFKYKIEGLDPDWIDAGTRRSAFFSYLPPGGYTFKVIAANSDGVWNTEGRSLRIRVLPPFWRRWWFISLGLVSIAGLAFGAYRWRITALQRRNAQQEAFARQLIESQESERKRIAAELHDGLGQNLLVVKNRALLGLSQPNDGARAAAQLNEISTVVSQSIEEVRQIAANLHPAQLDLLGLTKALEAMISKVAAASQLDIAAEVDNIDGVFDATSEINLYRIVQESLNNIVKHARASSADVIIKRTTQNVNVAIHDNGRGFAASEVKSGFGLSGIAERVRMLGGAHALDSIPGKGTTVRLSIELKDRQIK